MSANFTFKYFKLFSMFLSNYWYHCQLQVSKFFFFSFETGSHSVAQAGVQWHGHGSLSVLTSWAQLILLPQPGTTGVCHHAQLIFCIFSRDEVLPRWQGWPQTPGLKWSAHLCLPKCWDYRREPPHPAYRSIFCLFVCVLFSFNITMCPHFSFQVTVSTFGFIILYGKNSYRLLDVH